MKLHTRPGIPAFTVTLHDIRIYCWRCGQLIGVGDRAWLFFKHGQLEVTHVRCGNSDPDTPDSPLTVIDGDGRTTPPTLPFLAAVPEKETP